MTTIQKKRTQTSKFLSLILRHSPETVGIKLDKNGWADVDELLEKINLDFETLDDIVETNDKKRFSFNEDLTKIRANQGHSINIDLELKPIEPPHNLYHGTIANFLRSIAKEGLTKQNRQYVHLSKDTETAKKVGMRRGKPIILAIRAEEMYEKGYKFYLSENGVWLTDHVPAKFIHPA